MVLEAEIARRGEVLDRDLVNLCFEPSGRLPGSANWSRSIFETVSPFRATSIFGPLAVMVMWFHSPAGFWALTRGATRS